MVKRFDEKSRRVMTTCAAAVVTPGKKQFDIEGPDWLQKQIGLMNAGCTSIASVSPSNGDRYGICHFSFDNKGNCYCDLAGDAADIEVNPIKFIQGRSNVYYPCNHIG